MEFNKEYMCFEKDDEYYYIDDDEKLEFLGKITGIDLYDKKITNEQIWELEEEYAEDIKEEFLGKAEKYFDGIVIEKEDDAWYPDRDNEWCHRQGIM